MWKGRDMRQIRRNGTFCLFEGSLGCSTQPRMAVRKGGDRSLRSRMTRELARQRGGVRLSNVGTRSGKEQQRLLDLEVDDRE